MKLWRRIFFSTFDTAVHKHDGGEKVEDQENDTNNEENKHGIAQTFNLNEKIKYFGLQFGFKWRRSFAMSV